MGNQTSSLNSDVYMSLDSSSRTSSPLNIKDFLIRYRKYLPLVVSTCGMKKKSRSKASFGEGHSLCVHFQKESDVVLAVSKEGAKYFVPVRSTFMCSPVYDNPRKKGPVFEGVMELLQHSPLPQMVYTTQGYLSPSGEEASSIEEGQILVIKGTEILNGQNTLWCIDIHSYEQKNLEMSCTASFSTDTSLLRLVLASIIDHLTLPIDVVFSAPNSDGSCVGFPESLICTLTNKFETQSIITSPYSVNPSSNPPKHVVEILSDAPIQVCVLSLSKEEERVLKEMTRNLLTTFSPNLVAEVVGHITTPIDAKIQTALFQCLEQDYYWSKEFVSKELVATLRAPSDNQAHAVMRNKGIEGKLTLQTNFYEKEEEAEISEDTYEEVGTFHQQEALPSMIPLLSILPSPKHDFSPSMMQRHSVDTASLTSHLRKEDSNKADNGIIQNDCIMIYCIFRN